MNTRKLWLRLAHMGLVIVLVLPLSVTALADDGVKDVGAVYPSADAPPWGSGGGDLPYTRNSARSFYYKMRGAGYTGSDSFLRGNNWAWEEHWKRSALGGTENYWVDDVDIMFFHDHGGNSYLWFPWGGHDDTTLVPNDCRGAWGDKDVEWIGIKSCLTLIDRLGWARCMNGIHLIAGMTTLSYGANYGGAWADQMLGWRAYIWPFGYIWLRSPKTVTQAWFTACDSTQPSSVIARVIAEHPRHFSDKVHGRGGPAYGDVVDNWYHWIDHRCFKPAPAMVDVSMLAEVPAYEVLDRSVDAEFAQSLANTLNISGTLALSPDGQEYAITDTTGDMTRTLSIHTATGGYLFQDLSQLWVPPKEGEPLNLPDPEKAADLAETFFLATAQALPGGQNFDRESPHVHTDSMSTVGRPGTAAASADEPDIDVDRMVTYGRTLGMTATSAAGEAVSVGVSVAGPGGSTKLYLGGQGGAPIGLSGGSRDVQEGNPVILKDVDATWEAFDEDPGLAVLPIPVDYDDTVRHTISDTFTYYEQPLSVRQQELIPAWVYDVDFMKDEQVVLANALVYVPASADYYPPDVAIDSPLADAKVFAGRQIQMDATVTGGNAPFTYEWSSGAQGVLGTDEDITSILLSEAQPDDPPQPVTLYLKVTDVNGLSRTATVTLNVVGEPVWLPLIRRN